MHQLLIAFLAMFLVGSIFAQFSALQIQSQDPIFTWGSTHRDVPKIHSEYFSKGKLKPKHQNHICQEILPIHYNLFIRPILDDTGNPQERFTAPGTVEILFESLIPTREILVHAREIQIQSESVEVKNTTGTIRIISQSFIEAKSTYQIVLENSLEKNEEYKLTIGFTSLVSKERLFGLFLGNLTDPATNTTAYIAATHFESTEARRAFPCFDQPDLKATFNVSIGRKKSYHSLSNMDIMKVEPVEGLRGWVWDHYATTPKMSTYLLAFVVSNLVSEKASTHHFGWKPVKCWGRPTFMHKGGGAYAAESAAKVLYHYQNSFNTTYPLPKMDLIALPQFMAGAMENWGAITFSENAIMYFGRNTTEAERYSVVSTVAHEAAHQYFGDLVTIQRWSHLWLNEGFAMYLTYDGVNAIAPEFRPHDMYVKEKLLPVLRIDALATAHALVNDSASNINSTGDFDYITYSKGAALLTMMKGFIGEAPFRKALEDYLHSHAYGNVLTDDFFRAVQNHTNITGIHDHEHATGNPIVKEIMDTYVLKPGFPLIRISLHGNFHQELVITQEKFLANKTLHPHPLHPHPLHEHPLNEHVLYEHWYVPLSIKTSLSPNFEETKPDLWMHRHILKTHWRGGRILLGNETVKYDWLVVNPKLGGYYRVLYDERLTSYLQSQLLRNHNEIPPIARARLIDDYFCAANADYLDIGVALDLTTYLEKETEYVVWTSVFSNTRHIYTSLATGISCDVVRTYFRSKVTGALDLIGWEQTRYDKGVIVTLRAHLLDWACSLGSKKCLATAKRLVDQWMDSPKNHIPADIQQVMLCAAATDSNEVWDFVWQKYLNWHSESEKNRFIGALSCSTNRNHTEFLVNEVLFNPKSRFSSEDALTLLKRIAWYVEGNEIVFSKLKTDLRGAVRNLGSDERIGKIIYELSIYWTNAKQLKELEEFIREYSHVFESDREELNDSVKKVESNIQWVTAFGAKILKWMKANVVDEDC